MKFHAAIPLIMIATGMSSAQLLPQKQSGDLPKIDRALIFKLDYERGMAASDSSSKRIDASIKEGREKGNYLKNALIWNGLCLTGAALSSAFGGHGPIDCRAH